MKNQLDGKDITNTFTLGSMYDNNSLGVAVAGDRSEDYRIKAEQVAIMVNDYVFDLEKKRKYTYLSINWDKTLKLRRELT